MQALAAEGHFAAPTLLDVERALVVARRTAGAARVFIDAWDLGRLASCAACAGARLARMASHNLEQRVPEPVGCAVCGEETPS